MVNGYTYRRSKYSIIGVHRRGQLIGKNLLLWKEFALTESLSSYRSKLFRSRGVNSSFPEYTPFWKGVSVQGNKQEVTQMSSLVKWYKSEFQMRGGVEGYSE